MPSAGPKTTSVKNAEKSELLKNIRVVNIDQDVITHLALEKRRKLFSQLFKSDDQGSQVIGSGDIIEVSIWEVPPALFSGAVIDSRNPGPSTHVTTFPDQMVTREGTINIPYAGYIPVSGKTSRQIEQEIQLRLRGKANQPQVLVRIIKNNTANVTVVGEVNTSTRMQLTAKRERILDALAAASGVRQSVNKMTLQLTRGNHAYSMPLDQIIRDPLQNITLQADDVVTLMYQPLSFLSLGATGKNEEISFESQGISLSQALARAGGLLDNRANANGVFVFRFERTQGTEEAAGITTAKPVIYCLNLKDPASFFLGQNFDMQDKDIVYVSNAPSSDLQKFLGLVVSVVYPIVNVMNAVQ